MARQAASLVLAGREIVRSPIALLSRRAQCMVLTLEIATFVGSNVLKSLVPARLT